MGASTEAVTLIAQKMDLPAARKNGDEWAKALSLRVDAIDEKPRRLSTALTITLTGEIEQIERFRSQLAGDGFSSSAYNPQDVPVAWLLWWLSKKTGRWRRRRAARKAQC
jgi:hypothetical protein